MKYSHNGKSDLTAEQYYESVVENGDTNIIVWNNAVKFYRQRNETEKMLAATKAKNKFFGIVGKGKKRLFSTPSLPKNELQLKIKTENCMTCKFAKRDTRNAIVGARVICSNPESFKHEMPVDAKQVCKRREAKGK